MKISIENFRTFKEKTSFEIRPLTILVGPNNSGKSSFTKLLLLLKNGYETLQFKEQNDHHLESFEKALNWDSKSDEMTLSFQPNFYPFFNENPSGKITYKDSEIKKIVLLDGLIKFNREASEYKNYEVSLDIVGLVEVLKREIGKIAEYNDSYLFYDLFFNDEVVTSIHREKMLELQNSFFNETRLYNTDTMLGGWSIPKILDDIGDNLNQTVKNKIVNYFQSEYEKDVKITIKENAFGKFLFQEKMYSSSEENSEQAEKTTLFKALFNGAFTPLTQLSNISYIPANRGNQSRIIPKSAYAYEAAEGYYDKWTSDDKLSKAFNRPDQLFNEILEILEIEGEIEVKNIENTVTAIYIKTENGRQNIADFGFGYSQLLPMIFEIYNSVFRGKKYVIIEEPEANLHPKLQSKLADIFVAVQKHAPNLRLIIETHSEYLIRKLQYLVAKQEIKTDDCLIHYFKTSEKDDGKGKIKNIRIEKNGRLSQPFGKGFLDEADNLAISLMKYSLN